MACAGSGLGAGPATTLPSLMLNWLPWQGQSIVPFATWSTMHCICVHTALNPLKSPAAGWVTTTRWFAKTLPSPMGMSLVAASTLPPCRDPPVPVVLPAAPDDGPPDAAEPPPPHAASAPTIPATPVSPAPGGGGVLLRPLSHGLPPGIGSVTDRYISLIRAPTVTRSAGGRAVIAC